MKLTGKRLALLIFLAVIIVFAARFITHKVQGPELSAYRIQSQPLTQTVVATGRVTSASRAQIGAEISGVIIERHVHEGDQVQAGDKLVTLRSDELIARLGEAQASLAELRESSKPQADAALNRAQARFDQANREATRRQDLLQRKAISRETMEQAIEQKTAARAALEQAKLAADALAAGNPADVAASNRLAMAQAALDKTMVRALVSGTVLTRNAEPGDVVQPGRVLFEIARDGQTELIVPVDERNLAVLSLGQPALCVTDAYPDQPFPATVSFIAPAVDPQRGSVDIRLQLDPVPDFLRQDMTVSVNIETGRREQALVAPNDALDNVAGGQAQVWRVHDGRIQRTQVTLGLRGLALTEITNGLENGDLILANADASLVDGSRARAVEEALPNDSTDTATARETPVKFD
ncbi:efflux RND transporter periplasmic adaptor subunit [Arenicella xantha]|uniref:HlyD family secretion protein n=1 Tax=Arenicella xantha TaxID=644221 RepID=A0A395JIX3_9GAMM|nr:efflux RND transporter periplasmic adaptor subunit [Arenicella xantha]RBP50733.1 HlyD family secretion protein [Arenicella xantha]